MVRQGAAARAAAARVAVIEGARLQINSARQRLPMLRDTVLNDAGAARRMARQGSDEAVRSVARDARHRLADATRRAEALVREIAGQGPQKTLGRGFALVRGADGRALTDAATSVRAGLVHLQFQDGRLAAQVDPASLVPDGGAPPLPSDPPPSSDSPDPPAPGAGGHARPEGTR